MHLRTVFVRFYKSFNFDYLRKYRHSSTAKQFPWEMLDSSRWYPHVRIPMDARITTVVGANESGKSQLLSAIEKGLTGQGIERQDFCRYSEFYTVEAGKWRWPDFGFEWGGLTAEEREAVQSYAGISEKNFDRFFLFRSNRTQLTVYVPKGGSFTTYSVADKNAGPLMEALPRPFRIDADVALPEGVPIRWLASLKDADLAPFEEMPRDQRFSFFETLAEVFGHSDWFQDENTVKQQASSIAKTMRTVLSASQVRGEGTASGCEIELAKKLLYQIAGVDAEAINDLYHALRGGKDGHANGLIQRINGQIATKLNFPRWWVQDKHFELRVSSRDHDLVFTIRDRTGTEYSFRERSDGLKYFLSYYVQYRAHVPQPNRSEILLMDEPDAYLSSQAQQDLLKVFHAFAYPEDERRPVQVVFVTHSPFLIDKNHSERIRVLEKGVGDEGTRVVRDVSRNHYEPLRSAFGAFVGETVFIGNCNLIVEGAADQVLLAGVAAHLTSKGAPESETLDLNRVTIVPAGSATHVPYVIYLARGRDIEQPAVVALLDSDDEGSNARNKLRRGGAYGKQLLKDEYVLQVGEIGEAASADGQPLIESEDLVPEDLALEAVRIYLRQFVSEENPGPDAVSLSALQATDVNQSYFKRLQKVADEACPDAIGLTKIGFARSVVQVLENTQAAAEGLDEAVQEAVLQFETNMRGLFTRLNRMRRQAERELSDERVSHRIERAKNAFLNDHEHAATREQGHVLLEELESALDADSPESDHVRLALQQVRRKFSLDVDRTEQIADFEVFRQDLEGIQYAARQATQEPEERAAAVPEAIHVGSDGSHAASTASGDGESAASADGKATTKSAGTASSRGGQPS